MTSKPLGAGLALALVMLPACTSSPWGLNKELAAGAGTPNAYTPETFRPEYGRVQPALAPSLLPPEGSLVAAPAVPASSPPPAASITGIDRSNWAITRVDVPNDLAAHQAIYTQDPLLNTTLDRNRGSFPTVQSANQVASPDAEDAQRLELLAAPAAALGDIVMFIPRAIVNPPWQTVRSGLDPYRRAPLPRSSISPVLTTPRRGPNDLPDPAAAPVQVPIGETHPVPEPAPGAPQKTTP